MRVIFLGTPDFAVGTLSALVNAHKNIVAVVTAPDRPAGRGKKLQESAVKKYALEKQIAVLQPNNLKDPDFLAELKSYNAEIQIVVAFRMLPELVWNMPPKGTFNLHASLLPQYRGAAPINWAIINGEKTTGVSTFFLKHEIDTGDILMQQEVNIEVSDNVGSLHDKLMNVGANLVTKTLTQIELGTENPFPQKNIETSELKIAPKIFKPDCKINWTLSSERIQNKIRGLSPYPAAFTKINIGGKVLGLKIYSSRVEQNESKTPGHTSIKNNFIGVQTADGILWITELQLEGKKRMKTEDFLRGVGKDISLNIELS